MEDVAGVLDAARDAYRRHDWAGARDRFGAARAAGELAAADLDALATGGRLMVIGVGAGAKVELDLRRLMTRRSRILASNLRSRPLEEKADAARRVEHQALPLLADGRLRIPVAATFPLEAAQEAYDRFTAGGKLGKLVLVTGSA